MVKATSCTELLLKDRLAITLSTYRLKRYVLFFTLMLCGGSAKVFEHFKKFYIYIVYVIRTFYNFSSIVIEHDNNICYGI